MRRISALLLALMPICATAQMIDIQPGARVRLSSPGMMVGRIEGLVTARTEDSIVVLTSAPTQYRIALASVRSISVSQGKSRSKGALKGALWGGGILLALAIPLSGDPEMRKGDNPHAPPISVPTFLAIETLGGAGMGAAIGALIGSEKWASYESPGRVTVSRNGARVGASFAF